MADETLAATLFEIEDPDRFAASAANVATSRGIALPDATIRQAIQPDPLNMARFTARPPDGAVWPPRQWLPIDVTMSAGQAVVDWAFFGDAPLADPFFESSIRRAVSRPFNRMNRYRMTLVDFLAGAPRQQTLPPSGFIFHMSRCGSTLVAQILAAVTSNIVISEAAPIDAIVQLGRTSPDMPGQTYIDLLRAMVAAYGRRRGGREQHFFLKLDCWHALALPLFRAAFPETPWVFLYRDPVEVLVSHMRQRGSQMVPDITPPQLYGFGDDTGPPNEDYCARILAVICEAAADNLDDGFGMAVNYRELPAAARGRILPHFGVAYGAADHGLMMNAARQDAKAPQFEFAADAAGKQRDAKPALRASADTHLQDVYRRLEVLNSAHKGNGGLSDAAQGWAARP